MSVEVLENFFSKEQIDVLLKSRDPNKSNLKMNEWNDDVRPIFDELFDMLGVDLSSVGGYYFHTKFPFTTHSEGTAVGLDKKPINTTIFVPLSIEPTDSKTQTVFFNQFDDTPNQGVVFYRHVMPKLGRPSPVQTDYSNLINITDEPFDEEIYNKYLTHMEYNDLHGLTLHDIVKWNIGDVIKFDSTRLHCSSDFNSVGGVSKTHIVFKVLIPSRDDD